MVDALLRVSWLPKAIRIVLAALLVATVADLLTASTSQFSSGQSRSPLSDLKEEPRRQVMPGELVLTISVRKQQLTATYRLVLPRTEPLFQAVQRGEAAKDPRGLLDLLGPVEVGGNPVAFRSPAVSVGEGQLSKAAITVPAEPVTLVRQRSRVAVLPPNPPCCLPIPRIVVKTEDAQVLPTGSSAPLAQSAKQTSFSGSGLTGVTFDLLLRSSVRPRKAPTLSEPNRQPDSPDRLDKWYSLALEPKLLPGSASLTLRISKQVLTATYELTLDRERALMAEIQRGAASDSSQELVDLLGRIKVDDKPLDFDRPLVSIDQGRPRARVTLQSAPLSLAHPQAFIEVAEPRRPDCCEAGRSVVIETEGAQVRAPFPSPVSQSATQTTFGSLADQLSFSLVLSPFDADLSERQQVASLLRALSRHPLPALGWPLYWAVMGLPLLLLLLWHRRRDLADLPQLYVGVIEILLAFLLVMLAGSGLAEVAARWAPSVGLAWILQRVELWSWDDPRPASVGGPVLILLAAGFVWPLLASRLVTATATLPGMAPAASESSPPALPRAHAGQRRSRLASFGVGLLVSAPLLGALLVAVGAFATVDDKDRYLITPGEVAVRAAVAAVLLVGLLGWICRELGLRPPNTALAAAAATIVALALLENLSGDLQYPKTVSRVVVTVVCFALAASLLYVVVHIAARPVPQDTPIAVVGREWTPVWARRWGRIVYQALAGIGGDGPDRRLVWPTRIGLAVLLLLLVLPNPRWSGQQFEIVNAWYAQELADWLIHVVYLALAVIVVFCLSDLATRTDQPASKSAAQYLCFLLLLIYVFDPGGRIFYFPLTFVVGWLTFSWLLPSRQAALVDDLGGAPRRKLVEAAVAAGRERRAYRARRKDLLAKVASGDITRAEYRQSLDTISKPTQAATVGGRPASEVGMLLGPHSSLWANGLLLARYSFWVSVPWVLAVYLRQELSGALQDREFLAAALLLPLISNVLQWPVIGFVFGYLYPWIRGVNGLWKGLSLAGALIVPWLLLNLAFTLIGDNESWSAFLYWTLQVFVTCVSTGFLADLATLREHGRGREQLTDIHNFSALAAWGSSVVAASAGGLVTLLSSTLGEFLKQYAVGGGAGPAGR